MLKQPTFMDSAPIQKTTKSVSKWHFVALAVACALILRQDQTKKRTTCH